MKLEIYLPCGIIHPVGLGVFSESIRRELRPMVTAIYDDEQRIEVVETGPFDSEEALTFKKSVYKLEPIFDYGLFERHPGPSIDVSKAQQMAIAHFAAKSTKKLFKNLPVSVTQDEPTMQTVEDAAYLFMMQNGGHGNLVFVDSNTSVIADAEDFKLYLVDVFSTTRRTKFLCGVVVCHMPSRAIRIEHKSPIRLSGLL